MKNKLLLKEYLNYLRESKKLTFATIRNYEIYLTRFILTLHLKDIKNLDLSAIATFIKWLKSLPNTRKTKMQPSTINYHLIALRGFLKFLKNKKNIILKLNDIELFRIKPAQKKFLDEYSLAKLLESPLLYQKNIDLQLRDKALLEIIIGTGKKVSQITHLEINAVKDLKLNNQANYWLNTYLSQNKTKSKYLFPNQSRADKQQNKKMSPRSIQRIIADYAELAGIPAKVTPQLLRKSFARRKFNQGRTPDEIKEELGIKNLSF